MTEAADVPSARSTARLTGRRIEALSERTESTTTWVNPDGSVSTEINAGPVRVKRGDAWLPVDLTLERTIDRAVRAKAHPRGLSLSGPAKDGSHVLASVRSGGSRVSMQWRGPLPEPWLEGSKATYRNVRPGVDLVIEATRTGFEQFLVIRERPRVPLRIDLSVRASGLSTKQSADGNTTLVDAKGRIIGAISAADMWDITQKRVRVGQAVRPTKSGIDLSLMPDPAFLAHPARQYPVTIDPSVSLWSTFDTYTQSDIETQDQSGQPDLRIGSADGGTTKARSYLNFDVTELRGKRILNAKLSLYATSSASCTARDWEVWSSPRVDTSTRWSNQPAPTAKWGTSNTTLGFGPACDDGWAAVDIPSLVQSWADQQDTTATVLLKAADESDSLGAKAFSSSDGTNPPRIDITYNTAPDAASGLEVSDRGDNAGTVYTRTATPTLSFRPSDPDGDLVTALFYVYDGNSIIASHAKANVPSGSVASWTLPSGLLQNSRSYRFRATSYDAWDVGDDAWVTLKSNHNTGLVLQPENCDYRDGARLLLATTPGYVCQQWVPLPANDGYHMLLNRYSHRVVDNTNCGTSDGNRQQQYLGTWSDCQRWRFARQADGLYEIWNKSANKVLDQGCAGAGFHVYIWQRSAGNNCAHWRLELTPANGVQVEWLQFTVDVQPPAAPRVSSTDYPNDNAWHKGAGQAGSFTFSPPAGWSSPVAYLWALDGTPTTQVNAGTGGTATVSVTPTTDGVHVLNVRSKDAAGQLSTITSYGFNVGRGGLLLPAEGARVFQRTKLSVQAEPAFTHVKFVYRRGSGAALEADVPAANLTTPSGDPVGSGYVPLSALNGHAVWNAIDTVGSAAGVVQVRAVLATSASGTGFYPTAWRTIVVDPNADGAAGTDIGPGSVNLQTGDYTISAQDAEEFGLTVSRTASSRDPAGGYQQQRERLTTNQQKVSTDTSGFGAHNVALVRATFRGHSDSDSLQITPISSGGDACGSTGCTFADVGGDEGGMRLGMQAGRSYRFSAWIYVPSATGLNPVIPEWGRWLTVVYRDPAGNYFNVSSNAPTYTDAWQQVTANVTLPANATVAFARLGNGFPVGSGKQVFYDDISFREVTAPFGPQWSTGTATDAADVDYTRLTFPQANTAKLDDADGSATWFSKAADGKFWPEPGAEGMTLTADGANYKLTEVDGTVSIFARQTADTSLPYLLSTTTPPSAASTTQYRYEFVNDQVRIKRVISPIEPGVGDCTTPTPARGCEALEYDYASATTATASTFGDFRDQVRAIRVWSTNPDDGSVSALEISRYNYDDKGRLREVWDPRGGTSTPKLRYDYDSAGRVNQLIPGDELPWRFDYDVAGSNDSNGGRLLRVRRETLRQGSQDQIDGEIASTVVYQVPLTRTAGGPYELSGTAVATWAQDEAPTDATAVFGPEDPVSVNTATPSIPGQDGYRAATVHYLDASGREINTAAPNGEIDSTAYDRFGNVVRTLEATNRALALGQLPDASNQLSQLGLLQYDTRTRATWLDTRSTYSADGIDELTERGPVHRVTLPENPDTMVSARQVTETRYDEGKPDAAVYHLATSTDSYAEVVDQPGRYDARTTATEYSPVLGGTSGWTLRAATKMIANAGRPDTLSSSIRYDSSGRALESRKVGAMSNGTDVRTTKSNFYTAGANALDAACGNRPEWAGQACVTKTGGAITGHDPSRMADSLPVKRVDAYNRFGDPTKVSETVAGLTRTTQTDYDSVGRVLSVRVTGGLGQAVPEVQNTYDPVSGESVQTRFSDGTAINRVFDKLGRLVRYTDADGAWTANEFDRFNKPVRVTDSLGTTQTFTYDRTRESRGFLTSFVDSVAGAMEPTYGPDGQLTGMTMPGGARMVQQFDPSGRPVLRRYERASDGVVIAASANVENVHGQIVRHTGPGSDKRFDYDNFGRLAKVADTALASGLCTVRSYTYDKRSNRTGKTVRRGASAGSCPADSEPPVSSTNHTHDSADRLTDPGWIYDAFGRITRTAVGLTNGFYANDLVASQTLGADRKTWTLDPALRFRAFTSERLVNGQWTNAVTKVNHYGDDSDDPRWIAEDVTLPTEVTRNIEGPDDDLAVTTGRNGDVLQLTSLHGDIMATVPVPTGGTLGAVTVLDADEFGIPSDETPAAVTARYGWLGGKQRSAEALGGVILMGVRLYQPAMGQFLSPDPEPGGSATAYDYCAGDPINCTDLDGRGFWDWVKRNVAPVVAKVAEVVSYIPGPIGAGAAAVSAGAYAISGNNAKAKEMAITAVASLIPGGRYAAKAVRPAARVARAAPRPIKQARAGSSCRVGNSFTPETPVMMADGSTKPIGDVDIADMIVSVDPVTGRVSAEPVLDVAVGYGSKHLIEIDFDSSNPAVLHATSGHKIWLIGRGWAEVGQLRGGDRVAGPSVNTAVVQSVADHGWLPGRVVYNLSVANLHTFLVVVDGTTVLAHNCPPIHEDPSYFEGATKSGLKKILKRQGYKHAGRIKDGNGSRWVHPTRKGVQVIINKGYPKGHTKLHRGRYAKVSTGKGKPVRISLSKGPAKRSKKKRG